jgi:hypothetical protein
VSLKSIGVRATHSADTGTPFGINLGVGASAVVAAVLVAAVIPAAHQDWRFGVVVAAVAGFAALSFDMRALTGVAVIAWLLADGFLENRLGELSWHGTADVALLTLLVLGGAAGIAFGVSRSHIRELRSRRDLDFEFRAMVTHFKKREKHDA